MMIVWIAGNCGNQAFPEMPWQFWKCLEFPQLPRHFQDMRNYSVKCFFFNLQCLNSGKWLKLKKTKSVLEIEVFPSKIKIQL